MNIFKSTYVDVIVPTYNGMPYLRDTVKSILSQDHKQLHLYIIDDGSSDRGLTKKFIKSIKDNRVHYVYQKNGGQAKARNTGIKKSKSTLVAFCDADDLWHKNKLTSQIEVFQNNGELGFVYGGIDVINSEKKVIRSIKAIYTGNIFHELLNGNCIAGSASMVLMRRSVIEELGMFREDFLIGEDWEMWLRVAKNYEIGAVNRTLASLRSLDDGMQQNWGKMATGLTFILPYMISSLSLNKRERRSLTASCMWEASNFYYFNKQRIRAIYSMHRCLYAKPVFLFEKKRIFPILTIYFTRRFSDQVARIVKRLFPSFYSQVVKESKSS